MINVIYCTSLKNSFKNRCQLSQFVDVGCQNDKKSHEKQQCHNAQRDLKNLSQSVKHKLMVNYNHNMISIDILCGKQCIALGVHIEDSESPSNNLGMFLTLIKMFVAKDSVLHAGADPGFWERGVC